MDNKPGFYLPKATQTCVETMHLPYWNEWHLIKNLTKKVRNVVGIEVVFLKQQNINGGFQEKIEMRWTVRAGKTKSWSKVVFSEEDARKELERTYAKCEEILSAELEDLPTFLSEKLDDTETYVLQWRLSNRIKKCIS